MPHVIIYAGVNKGDGMATRVRFAPSPTGHLHIGGARTALFNYLFARHTGGRFILRIEDTDIERSTEEFKTSIIDGMKWLGMEWDEGPFCQSERMDIYKKNIEKLLSEGKAYPCWCTPEELETRRQEAVQAGRDLKYDRRCRERKERPNAPFAVRVKAPLEGVTTYHDICRGEITIDNRELDDLVIARSDGTPTYNFTVVVDDAEMDITHIIRGDDHINNTPRQIVIYNALGRKIPEFAHLPMIYGPDKKKLSKRHGAVSVMEYQAMGFLPEAMLNYIARLGWAHGDQEIFTKDELVRLFDINQVGGSPSVFDTEKLLWVNSQHIMKKSGEELASLAVPFLAEMGLKPNDPAYVARVMEIEKPRARTLKEMAEISAFFFRDEVEIDADAVAKWLTNDSIRLLKTIKDKISGLPKFDVENLAKCFNDIAAETGLKMKEIAQPVRAALTGRTASPGLFEVMEVLGRERVLKRLSSTILAHPV